MFHLIVGGCVVIDLLRRLREVLFGVDVPRIDYWILGVDFLVLVAILWFEGIAERRHQIERKRAEHLTGIVKSLSDLMDEGQTIQWSLRDPRVIGREGEAIWVESVKKWTEGINDFLAMHSRKALIAFQLVSYEELGGNLVFHPNTGETFLVGGDTRLTYRRLVAQLENLRRIVERPEGYF